MNDIQNGNKYAYEANTNIDRFNIAEDSYKLVTVFNIRLNEIVIIDLALYLLVKLLAVKKHTFILLLLICSVTLLL